MLSWVLRVVVAVQGWCLSVIGNSIAWWVEHVNIPVLQWVLGLFQGLFDAQSEFVKGLFEQLRALVQPSLDALNGFIPVNGWVDNLQLLWITASIWNTYLPVRGVFVFAGATLVMCISVRFIRFALGLIPTEHG